VLDESDSGDDFGVPLDLHDVADGQAVQEVDQDQHDQEDEGQEQEDVEEAHEVDAFEFDLTLRNN